MDDDSAIISDLSIRNADPTDADLLVELGKLSFHEAFSEETDPEDMAVHLQTVFKVEDIKEQLNDDRSLFIIIDMGSVAAGYAYLHPETPPACVKDPSPIQLIRLYLRRDYYGRNVGNTLMKACLEKALSKGYQSVWLSSWELNHRANAFYKRWGFEIVGGAKFNVGADIQDDFIFAKKIEI
jgi:ribosomal protein S18 acetylase RimI-like enzyme